MKNWNFSIIGGIAESPRWAWAEFRALPSEKTTRDIHYITKYSKLDTTWEGVPLDIILEGVETAAPGIGRSGASGVR